jgi:hypothetical protein
MFEELFIKSKGKPVEHNGKKIFMQDVLALPKNSVIKRRIEFVSSNSDWKQAVVLATDGLFEMNGHPNPNKIILWIDTAPTLVDMVITSNDGQLKIYNAWKTSNGTVHWWHNGAAMMKEELSDGWLYRCNDGYPDDDFDELVFKLLEI